MKYSISRTIILDDVYLPVTDNKWILLDSLSDYQINEIQERYPHTVITAIFNNGNIQSGTVNEFNWWKGASGANMHCFCILDLIGWELLNIPNIKHVKLTKNVPETKRKIIVKRRWR